MKNFKQYLKYLGACKPAVAWAGNKTVEEVVATCHRGDWLLWLAKKCDIGLQPLTFAKGHCANTVRHLMKDERSTKAVDVAIAFGEGKATREDLDAANAAADHAAIDADGSDYVDAAFAAANAADAAAGYYAAIDAANAAADYDADYDANAFAAAFDANRMQTADICRKYIGELIIEKVNQILTQ